MIDFTRPAGQTFAMDPERVLQEAIALLAPKMPKGAVFKRSECLARIRELQQSLPNTAIVDEFVRIVSHEPQKYVEGPALGLERGSVPKSSAPEATKKDQAMTDRFDQTGRSSAPEFAEGDPHMTAKVPLAHSASPASPIYDHAMEGLDLPLKPGRAVDESVERILDKAISRFGP